VIPIRNEFIPGIIALNNMSFLLSNIIFHLSLNNQLNAIWSQANLHQ
jgi:hypothetical protein